MKIKKNRELKRFKLGRDIQKALKKYTGLDDDKVIIQKVNLNIDINEPVSFKVEFILKEE